MSFDDDSFALYEKVHLVFSSNVTYVLVNSSRSFHTDSEFMGPTCSVFLSVDADAASRCVDDVLAAVASELKRTRKQRFWEAWINQRPYTAQIVGAQDLSPGEWTPAAELEEPPTLVVLLGAGLKGREDYAQLARLGGIIAERLHGRATEPIK